MKAFVISMLLCAAWTLDLPGQEPSWVTRHPVSEDEYHGIGSASLSDPDHQAKATREALADIASQITVKLGNESFLHQVDVDGEAREMFENKISGSATAWIEGHELKGTCSSGDRYYVYYVLDKKTYEKNAEKRRQQAVSAGLDCLLKGRAAEQSMNLAQAVAMYAEGLSVVEPWLFMDLTAIHDGKSTNVPVELYNSLLNVFSGMAIIANTAQITGEMYKAVPDPIAGCLSRNGKVVPNVKLKAEFVSGDGVITPPVETDYTGTSEFYVTNITSKEEVQEIRISIDESFWDCLPAPYGHLLLRQPMPSARITLVLETGPVSAYFHVENNDLEGCEKYIVSLLANDHFTFTEDPDAAICFIDFSTSLEIGDTVSGGIYDMNTCYCGLELKVYDNRTSDMLLDYSISGVKVLSPVDKSAEATTAVCIREVMKRVNRELPAKLGKVKVL